MSDKPSFFEYASNADLTMRDYIHDCFKWADENAEFDVPERIFELLDEVPDETFDMHNLMKNTDNPLVREFVSVVVKEYGNFLFGEMFEGMDIQSKEGIQEAIESMRSQINVEEHKSRSLLGPIVKSRASEAQDILEHILDEAKDAVYLALQTGDSDMLNTFTAKGKEALANIALSKPDMKDSDGYQMLLEIVNESENILSLIALDDDKYNAVYNRLIADFIEEEMESSRVNDDGLQTTQLLWRQFYDEEMQSTPVNGLVAILFDLDSKTLRPVTFCLHKSLHNDIGEAFHEQLQSQISQKFVMSTVMEFMNTHKEEALKYMNAREIAENDDGSLFAANITVSPEVQVPSAKLIKEIIEKVSSDDGLSGFDFTELLGKE